jgi:hypothetical protein
MGFQTSYASAPDSAKLGMLDGIGPTDKVTGYSAAVQPVGRLVVYNSAQDKVKLPAAATDILDANTESRPVAGIVMAQQDMEEQVANVLGVAAANVPAYPIGRPFTLVRKGRIWVWSEQAVCPTDRVYVRYTASGDNVVGNFRKDADSTTATYLLGARFATETTAAGLVLLEINLPA